MERYKVVARVHFYGMSFAAGTLLCAVSWDIADHTMRAFGLVREFMPVFFAAALTAVSAAAWKFCAPDCRLYTKDALAGIDTRPFSHSVVIFVSVLFTGLAPFIGLFGVVLLVLKLIRG